MTLTTAFNGMLTDPTKGIGSLNAQLIELTREIVDVTRANDLAALKAKLEEGAKLVAKLETFFTNATGRAAKLTTDQKGGIIDLSVPPGQRT